MLILYNLRSEAPIGSAGLILFFSADIRSSLSILTSNTFLSPRMAHITVYTTIASGGVVWGSSSSEYHLPLFATARSGEYLSSNRDMVCYYARTMMCFYKAQSAHAVCKDSTRVQLDRSFRVPPQHDISPCPLLSTG